MRWRSVFLVCASVAVAVGALAVVPAAVAQAHTELDYTLPAADEVVAEPVAAITLAFTDPVTVVGAGFEVFTPDERTIQPAFTTDDDRVFVLDLDPPLAGGAVGVRYEVAAGDGHVIDGAFAFTVSAAPPTTPAPTAAPPTAAPTVAPATTSGPTAAPATDAPTTSSPATTAAVVAPAPIDIGGDTDDDAGGGRSTGLFVGIAIVALLGAGAFVVLRSRLSRAP